ncbi:uncharacterized protein BDV17DRAFT_297930 [Aspergillus undulatus]|uniref:uncharacterized protein n=1 Tax=Aspergillus undulatus TaxID=1810928 RepID=UPI003CCDEF8D
MASPVQQPSPQLTNNVKQPYSHGGWNELSPGRWTRDCAAGETSVSYNQNVRDGHTELTINVPFSSNLSTKEVTQRVRNAWLVSHATHPEVAIQISTGTEIPQKMLFETLASNADATRWLQETLCVVTDQRAQDVARMTYSRRLPTKGKRNMLYLVTKGAAYPEYPDRHCIVWNFSHTLADIYSVVQFCNYILTTITDVPGDRDLSVDELDYSSVFDRLPVTAMTPYEEQYKPTAEQKEKAIAGAISQGQLYADKMSQSIAMYPEPDATTRPHGTHCIRLQYTHPESQSLLSALQSEKLSITFAAAAATVLAIKQTYGRGHETGALLGMTRNARRWIQTEMKEEGGYRVPYASDVVFLWIPFREEYFVGSPRDTILQIGRAIRQALGPHLTGPHYLASLAFTADRFVEALKKEGEPVPGPQAPGFSPQGALPLKKEFKSGSATIQAHDWVHTGRQINPSAWVGMFSLWGRVTLSMGFDSKYYEPGRMERFMETVKRNLGSVVTGKDRVGVAAKL